jgi:hypothetical protein
MKAKTMKKQLALAGLFLSAGWPCATQASVLTNRADTLFTSPIAFVSPPTVNFGVIRVGEFATNKIVVENVGKGTLVGKAKVDRPFKILSGGSYALDRSAAQIVTIVYSPDGAPTNIATITFTGGPNEVTATLVGRLSTKPRPYHWKRK